MVRIRSNIDAVANEWEKELLQEVDAAVRRAMTKTGLVGEARVKGIVEREAYDTGRLLRSINSVIEQGGDELRLIIGTALEYAIAIEEGRKPGKFPNATAILQWSGRQLRRQGKNARVNVTLDQLRQMARSNGKAATAQQKVFREQLAMAYLVGRKIAKKGIRGKYIFKRLEAGILAYFRKELEMELKKI